MITVTLKFFLQKTGNHGKLLPWDGCESGALNSDDQKRSLQL